MARDMRDRMLLFLLISSYLAYTTTFVLIQPVGSYSQLLKGALLLIFILAVIIPIGFPFKATGLSDDGVMVFILFGAFILYTLGLCFVSEVPTSSLTESFKYYLRIGFLFAFVLWVTRTRRLRWAVEFPVQIGTILAILGCLFLAFLFAGVDLQPIDVQMAQGSMRFTYIAYGYGLFGFGSGISVTTPSVFAWRLQSYFMEASKFALFLIYPMFLSYGLYRLGKKKRFLICIVPMAIAFTATFSLGSFAAVGCAVLLLWYFQLRRRFPRELRWAVVLGGVAFLAFTVYAAFRLSELYVPEDPTNTAFNRIPGFATGGSLAVRARVDAELLRLFPQYPFGVSLINSYDSKLLGYGDLGTPNAFMFFLSNSGFVGVGLFLLIFGFVYWRFMLPLLRKECLGRYVCVAAVGVWVHSFSYGTWLDLSFLYPLGLAMGLREIETNKRRDKGGFPMSPNGSYGKQEISNVAETGTVQGEV